MTPDERALTICNEFRDAVRVLMRRQNRTQEETAYAAGISAEHLSRMLRGREEIKIMTICRLADTLGYNVKLKLIRKEDRENDNDAGREDQEVRGGVNGAGAEAFVL